MKNLIICLLFVGGIVAMTADTAEARRWRLFGRRRYNCSNGNCGTSYAPAAQKSATPVQKSTQKSAVASPQASHRFTFVRGSACRNCQ